MCAELSVYPDSPSPFDVFIPEASGLEQFGKVTRKCMKKLLETIEKVAEYESGAIVENCRAELQTNEILSENMRIKMQMNKYIEENHRLQEFVQTLTIEKANLSLRLIKKGDYKADSQSPEKCNEDIEKLKNERNMYKEMLEKETKKNSQIRFQHEVSNERLIKSKAFKNLISQAKSLKKKLDGYRERNDGLYKYKEEFQDTLRQECKIIIQKEEEKRKVLLNEAKSMGSKIAVLEKEKNEACLALEELKTSTNERKSNNNWHELVEILTKDKDNLRQQNTSLKQQNSELLQKIADLDPYRYETSQDPELQKLQKIIEELKQKFKSEHLNVESLINEIEITGDAYTKIEEKAKSLTMHLADQEVLYNKLMNEKVKESSWKSVYEQEKKAYEQKINALEDIIASNNLIHKEYETQLEKKQDLIKSLCEKSKEFESKNKKVLEDTEESLLRYDEIVEYKKDYMNSLKLADAHIIKVAQEKNDLLVKIEESKQSISELEDKLQQAKDLRNLTSTDELLNEEVAQYRVKTI